MQHSIRTFALISALICGGCASAPSSNASAIKPTCAQQCKDSYDACIQDCTRRASATTSRSSLQRSTVDKLNKLDEFLNGVK
jgi:hypothetical protein